MRDFLIAALMALTLPNHGGLIVNSFETTGQPLGVMSAEGKEVIPAKYSTIRYIGHGLYLARSIDEGLVAGPHWSLFNRAGKLLIVPMPANCELAGVYSLGTAAADKAEPADYDELPKDSVLITSDGRSYGLCDAGGNELLPCKYGHIDNLSSGRGLIFENSLSPEREKEFKADGRTFYYSAEEHALKPLPLKGVCWIAPEYSDEMRLVRINGDGKQGLGYLSAKGELVLDPKYERASNFEHGKAVVAIYDELPFGHHFVIDRKGNQISPDELFISSQWNSVFVVAPPNKPLRGLLDDKLNWIFKEDSALIEPFYFGTFRVGNKILDKSGKQIATDTLYNNPIKLRMVPKTEAAEALHKAKAFFAWGNPFAGGIFKVEKDHLLVKYPYSPDSGSRNSILPEDIEKPEAEKMFPRFALARCDDDRLIMREQAGTTGFDGKRFKAGTPGGPSRLEQFAAFLHQYDLIGMGKAQTCNLLQQYASKDPELLDVSIQTGRCEPQFSISVEIHFSGGRVKSWNFKSWGTPIRSEAVTENVVLVPETWKEPGTQ